MLYPPQIKGTLPAFYGDSLTIPFSMNKSVGATEVSGISLKIKNIQSDKYIFTAKAKSMQLTGDCYAKFDLTLDGRINKLNVGQHYKVQLAYIDATGTVGYYSTVGIIKYTTKPQISVKDLKQGRINSARYSYTGVYSQEGGDVLEKVYSYQFLLTDASGSIVKDSGMQIHNTNNDAYSYTSYDTFYVPYDLDKGKVFYIQYKVITSNNLEVQSPKYKITQQALIEPDVSIELVATMQPDNGYIELSMIPSYDSFENEIPLTGAFVITRSDSDSTYKEQYECLRFTASGAYPSRWTWKDFTVAQGKTYRYAIQQYNDFDLYSEKIYSNDVYADFWDMFLFDGERQLKLEYNPQVSSFKANILESKQETIGNKYPFIFRNGNVDYKEFPLQALISYLADDQELFLTNKDLGLDTNSFERESTVIADYTPTKAYLQALKYQGVDPEGLTESYEVAKEFRKEFETKLFRTTNLENYNITAERIFKLEVLDWLNDGKPKLFRSATEGNYLVRLLNNSLSPETQVGRMLHEFSSTAYEIADTSYESLNAYGIISTDSPVISTMKFKTVTDLTQGGNLIEESSASMLQISDMRPGDELHIQTEEGTFSVVIGITGAYEITDNVTIYSVSLTSDTLERYKNYQTNTPTIIYGYEDTQSHKFGNVSSITNEDVAARQFIGKHNVVDEIENIKTTILDFYYLHFLKRDVEVVDTLPEVEDDVTYPVYQYEAAEIDGVWGFVQMQNPQSIDFYLSEEDMKVEREDYPEHPYRYYILSSSGLYEPLLAYDSNAIVYERKPFVCYKDYNEPDVIYLTQESYERLGKEDKKYQIYSNTFRIEGNELDLSDSYEYTIPRNTNFDSIDLDVGVVLECGYSSRITNYSYEDSYDSLKEKKEELDIYLVKLKEVQHGGLGDYTITGYYELYNEYVALVNEIKRREES